jgi:hypothetical protein
MSDSAVPARPAAESGTSRSKLKLETGGDAMGPSAYAYVSVPAQPEPDVQCAGPAAWEAVLAVFAQREGYTLVGIFCDVRGRTQSGLYALVDAIHHGGAVAVVVPDLSHLNQAAALTGADLHMASRYLRARLLTLDADRWRPDDTV